jgi:hypothetical protein
MHSGGAASATEEEGFDKTLNITAAVAESELPATPYSDGNLQFNIALDVANSGKSDVQFGNDMILMDVSPTQDFTGVYSKEEYKSAANDKPMGGDREFNPADNYAVGVYLERQIDRSPSGPGSGQQPSKTTSGPESICNAALAHGAQAKYSNELQQGQWLRRDLSSRLLLALPEMQAASASTKPAMRYRMILTIGRATTGAPWALRDKKLVLLQKDNLMQMLNDSKSDLPLRILALNWLAAIDKDAARPILLENVKTIKAEQEVAASIQLLRFYKVAVDADTIAAMKKIAQGKDFWSKRAAEAYLKEMAKTAAAKGNGG